MIRLATVSDYPSRTPMHIVHVHVHVKPDSIEAFKTATLINGAASRQEPGIARFDIVQQVDDPTRFVLVEAYRTQSDVGAHKETAHYRQWRDTVEPMMAESRKGVIFINVAPDDADW
jgi:quinol monooxygenase YgiN